MTHLTGSDFAVGGGSFFAFFGGVFAAASNEIPHVIPNATSTALVVAFAGLATAIGGIIVPVARLWFSDRAEERRAKFERHELANNLHVAQLHIFELKQQITRNKRHSDVNTAANTVKISDLTEEVRADRADSQGGAA